MAEEPTPKSDNPVDLTEEEKYWREHHQSLPEAAEKPFEHFAPAYRVGAEAAAKHPGKPFHEIEDDIALDYEKHQIGSALPWDHVRGASKAAWSKVSGLHSPRDPSRGMRGSI